MSRHVVVAGASGVVGLAAAAHLAADATTHVTALSRREPQGLGAARFEQLDLSDPVACEQFATTARATTHLVYAAVREAPGLVDGWHDPALIAANTAMFTNLLDALLAYAPRLRHVTLLQGTKAYGVHVEREVPIPCRESSPRHPHANFYFTQHDALLERCATSELTWTVLRPQIVFGDAIGSNMNPAVALGAYAALCRAEGRPLAYPGGPRHVSEACDAHLLARAIGWCLDAPVARNEIFNVANGDVFVWRDLWPAIAAATGTELGEDEPQSLVTFFSERRYEWATLAAARGLIEADLDAVLGQSARYADMLLGAGRTSVGVPQLVSTIKLRHAGFADCIDTEEMLTTSLRRLAERGVLPMR